MLPSNLRKLKAAYRHPFEYINPRLYQRRALAKEVVDPLVEDKFFVENEEEFQALQEINAAETSKQSDLWSQTESQSAIYLSKFQNKKDF